MSLTKILLSSIASIALCGGLAMAQAPSAYPTTSPSTSYTGGATTHGSSSPAATGDTTTSGALNGATGATSGTSISAISNPKTALKSAAVESSDGTKVGKVSKVNVDASGQAKSLDIKVGAKTVSLPAAEATFNENSKIVVAQLTASDIKSLPKVSKPSTSSSSTGMSSSPSSTDQNSPSTGGSAMGAPAAPSHQ